MSREAVIQDFKLRNFNSFGIDVVARYWFELTDPQQLSSIHELPGIDSLFVLGGGSNVLFLNDYQGLMLKISILGKEIVKEDQDHIWLKVAGGENWHDLVMYTVDQGWGGIENLALIPGQAGTAPVQNIGAYGCEIKDIIDSLEFFHLEEKVFHQFSKKECKFGYRDSIFKQKLKDKTIITSVVLKLDKKPVINTSYGPVAKFIEETDISDPGPADIAAAIISIRESKLPDPEITGNAGSFFRNPLVSETFAQELKKEHPDIPIYPASEGFVKLAAAWLIDQCGWKGKSMGKAAVHDKQALVLINKGGASGKEILNLAEAIQADVRKRFGIFLVPEVNIIDGNPITETYNGLVF